MDELFPDRGTAIEGLLPKEFTYLLGLYLQTCAHIELLTSALVVFLGGLRLENENWFDAYCQVRKLTTKELNKELKKSSELAKEFGFSEDLYALSDWIERFVQNRHMAAHGAFFGTSQGFLRVDYVTNIGSRSNPKFRRQTSAVTRELVDEALKDADRIYLIVLGMIGLIRKDLPISVHHAILPIVKNPNEQA
ncbi:hypothetical protein [Ruegeria marina]|uniref:Uncharacterized protein n=1 Tax=Ruegeria marina TaxID=639004 RepID=A0A1G6RXP6_9RHOB|nr:hypothetical protein [Ruegeria marina]SDD09432.1 hypothetical protein SAMN04488239_105105 [Ruegeria marina]